jgi:hypothetical protein
MTRRAIFARHYSKKKHVEYVKEAVAAKFAQISFIDRKDLLVGPGQIMLAMSYGSI